MKNNEDVTEHRYCIELVNLSSGWLKISSILPKNDFFYKSFIRGNLDFENSIKQFFTGEMRRLNTNITKI